MPLFDSILSPVSKIIDKVIPDPEARDRAKLELLKLENSQELQLLRPAFRPSSQKPPPAIPGRAAPGRAFSTSSTP